MSLPVPTEILFEILQHRAIDRRTLCNVRLASKELCTVATEILFENINVHYGFDRSIAQMKAVISNPLIPLRIRSIFIPSESFFPLANEFQFRDTVDFKWSHRLTEDGPSRPEVYSWEIYGSELHHGPRERQIEFDATEEEFRNQSDMYRSTIVELFEACVNLRAVHFGMGGGHKSERIAAWSRLITSTFPTLAKVGVQKLEISVPALGMLSSFLEGYDNKTMLQSLTSIAFNSKCLGRDMHMTKDSWKSLEGRVNPFLLNIRNLKSYQISNGWREFNLRGQILLPSSMRGRDLTYLAINKFHFMKPVYTHFIDTIRSLPFLKGLSLEAVELNITNLRDSFEPDPDDITFGFGAVPSSRFVNPLDISWGMTFNCLLQDLPELVEFTFRGLLYSQFCIFGGGSRLIVPLVPKEWHDTATILRGITDGDLISPYKTDHLALMVFKEEINKRRGNAGLRRTEGIRNTIGLQQYASWRFATI